MRVAKKISTMALPILLGAAPVFAQQQSQQQSSQSAPPSSQSTPSAPAQTPSTPQPKKPSTADDNPFPEDISRKAAQGDDAAPADGKAPASSEKPNGSSAAPADTDSSSRSKFQGLGDLSGDGSRISNGAGGYILNPKLATQDVKVGGFYLDQRDYKGAYSRYMEATLVDPGNADAVFGLAEAARGMNHKDEAVQNYRIYLDAFPDGKRAKEARKALAALGAAPRK
jgi:tetratricopeptide (TPR) repeat protein